VYIEKLQLSGTEITEPVSVTFQKGVFSPETSALDGIDVAKILTFFFYGAKALKDDEYSGLVGALYFCENSLHYRINASSEKNVLCKITALGEELIELEDGTSIGDALFGVDAQVFEATLGFGIFENEGIKSAFAQLVESGSDSVGIYDFMNLVREAASAKVPAKKDGAPTLISEPDKEPTADEGGVASLDETKVLQSVDTEALEDLEQTKVMTKSQDEALDQEIDDPLDATMKIAPATDLEIEEKEAVIKKKRKEIDALTTELEGVSRKIEIGKMSDLSSKVADYKEKKENYEKVLEKKRGYEDKYRAGTIELPDNDYVRELSYAIQEIRECEVELRQIYEERESIDPEHNNNKLSNLYIKVENDGGIDAIREKLGHLMTGKRIYMLSALFFMIAGVFFVATGAVVSLLPVYKNMFIASTPISIAHVGLFVLTAGLMCLIPSLACMSGMQSVHESILEFFADYGCEGAKNSDEFLYTLELAINESEEKKERLEKLRSVEKKVAKCQSRVNEGQRIIREHLTIWDKPFDSRLSYCENATSALELAKEFLSEYEDYKNDAERARALCDEAGYLVMSLGDGIFDDGFDPEQYHMSSEQIAQSEELADELKNKLEKLYDELDALKKERDELVFAENEKKAQKARLAPDPWLCELIDKLEAVANGENANSWEMAIARSQMIASDQKNALSQTLLSAVVLLASFETLYDKVMPPQFIRVGENKEQFIEEFEKIGTKFVSGQIVIY